MSASASVYTLTPLPFQGGLSCLLKPASGVDLALPIGFTLVGLAEAQRLKLGPNSGSTG